MWRKEKEKERGWIKENGLENKKKPQVKGKKDHVKCEVYENQVWVRKRRECKKIWVRSFVKKKRLV